MKEGHIWIDDVITEDYHLKVKRQLEANADADLIVLHIQSPGGSVYGGYNAYHVLKSSGKKIKSIIEGEAQSMATFISLAGDEVEIRNPSVYMIHNPSSGIEGDADAMVSGASELRNIEDDMANAYSAKTKIPVEKIKEMMKQTTVLNAVKAKELGFADRVIDPLRMVAIGKTKKMDKNIFETFGKRMAQMIAEVFPPKNMDVPLKSGGSVFVDTENGDFVGKMATIDGQPAPAGEHELADGRVIVVNEMGMITEVKEAAPAETAEQKQLREMNAQMEALKAEVETLKGQKAAAEAQVEAEKQTNIKAAQALGTLQKEFEDLRKQTVGNSKPPKAAPVFKKEPVGSGDDDIETLQREEILQAAGLGWIKNYKK